MKDGGSGSWPMTSTALTLHRPGDPSYERPASEAEGVSLQVEVRTLK